MTAEASVTNLEVPDDYDALLFHVDNVGRLNLSSFRNFLQFVRDHTNQA